MAISTYKVFLMYKETEAGTYDKLIDIKDFPDLGGEPEQLETTTLSDKMNTYIPGIQSLDALEFTANYTASDYARLRAMEEDSSGTRKEYYFAVYFGGNTSGSEVTPTGVDGIFKFKGKISSYPTGGGVNEVVDLKISISPSTVIVFEGGGSESTIHTVTYNKNSEGASGTVSPQRGAAGTVISLSTGLGLTAPEGKAFAGWATSAGAVSPTYVGGASYTITEDAELFAVWTNA